MRPRAGWMVMGERGRPSALDVCRVLAVFLSLFPSGKMLLFHFYIGKMFNFKMLKSFKKATHCHASLIRSLHVDELYKSQPNVSSLTVFSPLGSRVARFGHYL